LVKLKAYTYSHNHRSVRFVQLRAKYRVGQSRDYDSYFNGSLDKKSEQRT